jgi:hypothetical protein
MPPYVVGASGRSVLRQRNFGVFPGGLTPAGGGSFVPRIQAIDSGTVDSDFAFSRRFIQP